MDYLKIIKDGKVVKTYKFKIIIWDIRNADNISKIAEIEKHVSK